VGRNSKGNCPEASRRLPQTGYKKNPGYFMAMEVIMGILMLNNNSVSLTQTTKRDTQMRKISMVRVENTPIRTRGKSIIVVLGMHRSGTSAITRGLMVLGVELGDHLMPPAPNDNDKGFFEDIDVNAINVELYRSLENHPNWHTLAPVPRSELLHEKKLLCGCGQLNCSDRDWKR
jgi:hypothetical protein